MANTSIGKAQILKHVSFIHDNKYATSNIYTPSKSFCSYHRSNALHGATNHMIWLKSRDK